MADHGVGNEVDRLTDRVGEGEEEFVGYDCGFGGGEGEEWDDHGEATG